jgi:hypothetical protein
VVLPDELKKNFSEGVGVKKINSPRYLFLLGLLTFLLVAGVLLSARVYEHFNPQTKKLPDAGSAMKAKVDPALTSFERGSDIKKLNEESHKRLHSYGWVHKEKGIIHVPIAKAMELYLKQEGSAP